MYSSFLSKNKAFSAVVSGMFLYCLGISAAAADPVAIAPYTLSVFTTGSNGNSQPDSLALWRRSVLVGYGNGVAKNNFSGQSTIVQYSLSGTMQRSFTVRGHNDGLRLVGENSLWALQNEDANPALVVIDLETGQQRTYIFPPTVHGGGYDDLAVKNGRVFISASNPTLNSQGINVYPTVLEVLSLAGGKVHLVPVIEGNDPATDIPTGSTVSLNVTDPDSMSIDPRGNIILEGQNDAELVFIAHPFTEYQTINRLNIIDASGAATQLDDMAFAPSSRAFMLVADLMTNTVYRIDEPSLGFEPGTLYSSANTVKTTGFLSQVNLDTGVLTPVATGFLQPKGVLFVTPVKSDED
jgi:hypothetical protein